jgi:hypothetical protein
MNGTYEKGLSPEVRPYFDEIQVARKGKEWNVYGDR